MEKEVGTIKWFDSKKGFGFIIYSDGLNIFVHSSDISKEGFEDLFEGDEVEFLKKSTKRGMRAVDVKKI